MRYKILHIAYPLAPVNANTAGGAEQVLYLIDKALTEKKHNSNIIACRGSVPNGKLIQYDALSEPFNDEHITELHSQIKKLIHNILAINDYDIIHMHGIDFDSYIPETETPIIVTLHLPVSWYNQHILNSKTSKVFYNCVSESQQRTASEVNNLLPFINNGIDLKFFRANYKKKNYSLSLGRICWEKGYNLSIMAAQMSGTEFILAGKVFPYYHHQKYFNESILPSLNGRDIKFIDSPDLDLKRKLLSEAKCVLIPSLVPETSSLVAMEALASGTPVIAFPSGAHSEIIEHGRTGFIVNNTEEMAEAIRHSDEIDPAECRKRAEERFNYVRMADEYLSTYRTIIEYKVKHRGTHDHVKHS